MSTRRRAEAAAKKISSCVRPGVCEVRASALRPVSALIRLDLPTLERPANAISSPCIGGSRSSVPAAAVNCQSAANSLRPDSISEDVNGMRPPGLLLVLPGLVGVLLVFILVDVLVFLLSEQLEHVVPQFDLGAVIVHDEGLLRRREGVVPGPVDPQPG